MSITIRKVVEFRNERTVMTNSSAERLSDINC
jgi:hypothetical protein